jgi:hypothetical protein
MSKTPAEKAIRKFNFGNYGMDDVDPKSEYAEWVPDLAAKIEAAVREQVAKDLEAPLAMTNAEMAALAEAVGDQHHEECGPTYMAYAARIARDGGK